MSYQATFRCEACFLTTFFRARLGKTVPSALPRDFTRFIGGREGEPNAGKIFVANKRFTSPGPAGFVGSRFLCHGLVEPCAIWRVW